MKRSSPGGAARRRSVRLLWAPLALASVVAAGCASADGDAQAGQTQGEGIATSGAQPSPSEQAPTATDDTAEPSGTTEPTETEQPTQTAEPSETSDPTDEPETQGAPPAPRPSDESRMERVDYLTANMTAKSVVASGTGMVIANNMIYMRTATLWDTESREVLQTLPADMELTEYGFPEHPGVSRGGPVEAVWTKDGQYAYVSNYDVAGVGFGNPGRDDCSPMPGNSFVYRFNAETMAWDQAIRVGAVPKFVELSPDDSTLLVSNWCSKTVGIVDTARAEQIAEVPVNAAPRGIAILPDNRTAYVTAQYAGELYKIDIEAQTSEKVMDGLTRPRHLNLSPDGQWLYLTQYQVDRIWKMDAETLEIVAEVNPGEEPRSAILSPDGSALYVVNYDEASMSKIRTSDMTVMQKMSTDAYPIGITYEPMTHTVWVACYSGAVYVFDDTLPLEDG